MNRRCGQDEQIGCVQNEQTNTNEYTMITNNEYIYTKSDNENHQADITDTVSDAITEIINYLNLKLNSNYRAKNKVTQKHINARLKEGFTIDDFKTVIDKQYDKWIGTDMQQYLRPETLFGTKFESYLNALNNNSINQFKQQESRYADVSEILTEEQLNRYKNIK